MNRSHAPGHTHWIGPLAGLLLVALFLTPGLSSAQATATLAGTIKNGTEGGRDIAGLEVQLLALAHDTGQPLGPPRTTRTDTTGAFSFNDIEPGGKQGYLVSSVYQDVIYTSDLTVFQPGEARKTIELKVFEPTTNASAVRLRQQHLVIDVDTEQRVLKMLDISVLQNRGDTTFIGRGAAGGETFQLMLPPGIREINLDAGLEENTVQIPGGLAYTAPIRPGETTLVMTYLLDYTSANLTLTKTVSLAADTMDVLVADRGMKAVSPHLATLPAVELSGRSYVHLGRKNLAPGSPVAIQFSELPGASFWPAIPAQWPTALAISLGVGVGAYAAAVAVRRRGPGAPRRERSRAPRSAEPDEDELMAI